MAPGDHGEKRISSFFRLSEEGPFFPFQSVQMPQGVTQFTDPENL